MKDFIEQIIKQGNYILSEMEERIQKMYILGKITESDMTELLNLADENAKSELQIDIVEKLADLEARIAVLESAGVVVWKPVIVIVGDVTRVDGTVVTDIADTRLKRK